MKMVECCTCDCIVSEEDATYSEYLGGWGCDDCNIEEGADVF